MSDIKYDIDYSHLVDEIKDATHLKYDDCIFKEVKKEADEVPLALTDEEYMALYKMKINGKDANWVIHKMGTYKLSLIDALVSYITY